MSSTVSGTIRAPPSKSYTHRAIVLSALSGGPASVGNALRSDDTDATIAGMAAFGAAVHRDGGDLRVSAPALRAPGEPIDAGNSGTTLRLLAGVASLQSGETTLTGDASLRKRPMGPLLQALNELGAHTHAHGLDGRPPVDIEGTLRGGHVSLPGNVSSQFLSSLLIACPLARQPTEIRVLPPILSEPYVDATRYVMHRFGVEISRQGDTFRAPGSQSYRPIDIEVPGDFSSAAFPLVAAVLTDGDVTVAGLDGTAPQGDRRIVDILESFGARVQVGPDSVRVRSGPLVAQTVDVGPSPDLFPILAVLATQAKGESRFVNGEQLHLKESDRIASTVAMLRSLGVHVEPTPDGCVVQGPTPLRGAAVDSRGDHRILMAAGVAGLVASGAVDISDPWCFRISYPGYLDDFRALGALHAVVA